jgi:hypothetical protein
MIFQEKVLEALMNGCNRVTNHVDEVCSTLFLSINICNVSVGHSIHHPVVFDIFSCVEFISYVVCYLIKHMNLELSSDFFDLLVFSVRRLWYSMAHSSSPISTRYLILRLCAAKLVSANRVFVLRRLSCGRR